MAQTTINITLPILIAGQGFKIEYKEQGTSTWLLWGIITTNSVTITGLTAGLCYDFKITFLSAISPIIECDFVIVSRCIPDSDCITMTGVLVKDAITQVITLQITFSFPSPVILPCGGYALTYNNTTLVFPALPPNPLILPATNQQYIVSVYKVDCDGNQTLCQEITVPPLSSPCTHAVILSAVLSKTPANVWQITLTVTPSIPQTPIYNINYYQGGVVFAGVPDPGGTLLLNAPSTNPMVFVFPVNPNLNLFPVGGLHLLEYYGSVTDGCNFTSKYYCSAIFE